MLQTHMDYVILAAIGQGNVDTATHKHTHLKGALHLLLYIFLTDFGGWWQGKWGRGHFHSDPVYCDLHRMPCPLICDALAVLQSANKEIQTRKQLFKTIRCESFFGNTSS